MTELIHKTRSAGILTSFGRLNKALNKCELSPGCKICEDCNSVFDDYHGTYLPELSRSRCGSCHFWHHRKVKQQSKQQLSPIAM